jgi:hypothetical protein
MKAVFVDGGPSEDGGKWLDLLVVFVVFTSIAAVVLLICDLFVPKLAVLAGAVASLLVGFKRWRDTPAIAAPGALGWSTVAALLLFALVFRFESFPWIHGGQDQGVYYSMSAHYQNGGTIFFDDPVLAAVSHDEELRATYKQHNQRPSGFVPGVYHAEQGGYVFQFYHLHPLWMAIFADLFGDDARGASVVVFGLLSILFLSLLAFELSGSRWAAISVGGLLALNPLHAFFSKWPVTEVVALAFSAMGLYYLTRAHALAIQQQAAGVIQRAGWVAGLTFAMLFFVRISGFVYLPFLFVVFVLGAWCQRCQRDPVGAALMTFALVGVAGYVLSIGYGLVYSPNYALDIYRLNFGRVLGTRWAWIAGLALAAMLVCMAVAYARMPRLARVSDETWLRAVGWAATSLLVVGGVVLVHSLYKVYLLGYTNHYQSEPWLGVLWRLSNSGLGAVVRSSALNWVLYSSPLLLAVGLWAVWRRRTDIKQCLLLLVLVIPLALYVFGNPALPYQYYYARYLLSEAVPFALLLCVVSAVTVLQGKHRAWLTGVVVVSAVLFGGITLRQWGAEEGTRSLASLRKIAAVVDANDVLMVNTHGWGAPPHRAVTPLRFYFGLSTFMAGQDDAIRLAERLDDVFEQVWFLSPRPIQDSRFELVRRVTYGDKVMERVGQVPLKVVQDSGNQPLFLYVLQTSVGTGGVTPRSLRLGAYSVKEHARDVAYVLGDGWHAMERDRVWSKASAELVLRKSAFGADGVPVRLVLQLAAFGASASSPVRLSVQGDHGEVTAEFQSGAAQAVAVPLHFGPGQHVSKLRLVVSGAASPASKGMSVDERVLGVSLGGLAFQKDKK